MSNPGAVIDVSIRLTSGAVPPILKLVNIPKLVIFGWAAVWSVPVIAVEVKVVNPEPAVPVIKTPPIVVKDVNVETPVPVTFKS